MVTTSPTSSQPPDDMLPLFRQAVDLKAIGHSWTSIAGKLGCDERTLRRWRERYPDAWAKLMVEAYEDTLQRVGGAALSGLSTMISSKEHPQHWRGCQFFYGRVFQFMLTVMKLQWKQPPAAGVGGFWKEAIQQIESMTEEEMQKEIMRYVDTLRLENNVECLGQEPVPSAT
jgi:hypothetical protein